jgi:predicted nucleotide-binding protein (sugar kinase/HSP70/actin superfamily)
MITLRIQAKNYLDFVCPAVQQAAACVDNNFNDSRLKTISILYIRLSSEPLRALMTTLRIPG